MEYLELRFDFVRQENVGLASQPAKPTVAINFLDNTVEPFQEVCLVRSFVTSIAECNASLKLNPE
jgi:hypothetical protein